MRFYHAIDATLASIAESDRAEDKADAAHPRTAIPLAWTVCPGIRADVALPAAPGRVSPRMRGLCRGP